jgi:hypothetical protein
MSAEANLRFVFRAEEDIMEFLINSVILFCVLYLVYVVHGTGVEIRRLKRDPYTEEYLLYMKGLEESNFAAKIGLCIIIVNLFITV